MQPSTIALSLAFLVHNLPVVVGSGGHGEVGIKEIDGIIVSFQNTSLSEAFAPSQSKSTVYSC